MDTSTQKVSSFFFVTHIAHLVQLRIKGRNKGIDDNLIFYYKVNWWLLGF